MVMKNSVIPNYLLLVQKSVVAGKINVPSYSLVSGNPVILKKQGV